MSLASVGRVTSSGIEIRVRLTPKAAHDRIDGIGQQSQTAVLKARVRAVPEHGKANAALEKLLADWLDVPPSSVSVVTGQTNRSKTVAINGDAEILAATATTRLTAIQTK